MEPNQYPHHLEIDQTKCVRCGTCVKECPAHVLELTDKAAIEKIPLVCIDCGHCVAICPQDAITHLVLNRTEFTPVQNPSINLDAFTQLGKNRRSTRCFKQKPIPREILEQLLESTRYIPTAQNAQELQYIAITDPTRIKAIRESMEKKLGLMRFFVNSILTKWILRLVMGQDAEKYRYDINQMNEVVTHGGDPFLRGSPTLILIYVINKTPMCNVDTGIAGYHLNLAAETLEIGSCWLGEHTVMAQIFGSIKKASMIPKKGKCVGTLGLGYPIYKYRKNCARKPLEITYI